MKHVDIELFVRGTAQYIDDLPVPEGTLHAAVFSSPIACGEILTIDAKEAEQAAGVVRIFTAKDIPGQNQIGDVIPDEPLLAEKKVRYMNEPVAIVVADTKDNAENAVKLIRGEFRSETPVFNPREAYAKNQISGTPEVYEFGDTAEIWGKCDIIIEGQTETGAQEQLYFETQRALSIPTDQGGVKIHSSTQSVAGVQRVASRVLGIPMNKIEADVIRIGGGFGGKESQAARWAAMTALAATAIKRPVKLVLSREEDMRMTGKRHPYSSNYKIGLSKDGMILGYEAFFFQNAGAYSDLSLPVLRKSVTHATGSYFIPNVKVTGASCLTNIPPSTAFRGFGSPQSAFVLETAIYRAAEKLGVPADIIQKKNLLKDGDELLFGAKAENALASRSFETAFQSFEIEKNQEKICEFNEKNYGVKKGIAVFPLCFGVSFDASTFLDQASATVHIFTDGSVSVSTAAIEMGQGVNTKIREVAARTLSISSERIRIESTNTSRIANGSATAASSGADLNGNAVILACKNILERMRALAAEKLSADIATVEIKEEAVWIKGVRTDWDWNRLVFETYANKQSLSAHAFYTTPGIFSDAKKRGKLYAYHVFGTAVAEATVDCIRGTYEIDSFRLVHDAGKSLAPEIDLGQIEGALLQGIGWATCEEIVFGKNGAVLTDNFASYKIPDIFAAPKIETIFLEGSENAFGPFNSKAIGEPPLLYGIAAYFAIRNAMKAFQPVILMPFSLPLTPEKVLLGLHGPLEK